MYVYLFPISDGYVLIDAGLDMGDWSKKFFSALEKLRIQPNQIKYCIVSHEHLDHIGMIEQLKQSHPEMKVVMHQFTEQILKWESDPEYLDEVKKASKDLADKMISYGIDETYKERIIKMFVYWRKMKTYYPPDIIVSSSEELIRLGQTKIRLIWTPGHSFGHICIFNPHKKYLFSGDHILSRITPHIGNFILNKKISRQFDFSNILKYYLESLETIKKLEPQIIFPAHQKIIYNPEERIEEIFSHHQKRLSEIEDVIKEEPKTPFQISKEHFSSDLDETNTFLAVSEVLGHLIYLEEQERVSRFKEDRKIYFKYSN